MTHLGRPPVYDVEMVTLVVRVPVAWKIRFKENPKGISFAFKEIMLAAAQADRWQGVLRWAEITGGMVACVACGAKYALHLRKCPICGKSIVLIGGEVKQ